VAEFLIELYVSRGDGAAAERDAELARSAAEQLTLRGTPVRCLRGIFVPEDETCFLLYEAASAEAVQEAAELAGLQFDHVAEAVRTGDGSSRARRDSPRDLLGEE
jgi:uncharacterized protein DUF4242